ncbi:hypothetical protein BEL04_14945 [Mucilaginibacter sp. PPCGB 2223]|uniref:hypothetical protein n=1 Tax=Mucilaginibacter sp. PPCGB 2223 TaxID=1886027 RepID=UPI000826F34F|nr:hypothetical protein [Mucilaginibacter sp. PPCGB 2223]OCX51327.1 hypothetical protein BEL04_14945 [Mucilaginibacter sp. PPCGB 2223]
MNKFVLYFKHRPARLLGLVILLFISSNFASLDLFALAVFIFYTVAEYQQHKSYRNFLDKQGLTAQEYTDKKFIENWTDTRQAGLTRYCFFDGGIIIGSILSIFIGAAFFKSGLLGDITKDLSGMMELIWKSFVLGFMIAAIYYWLRWPYRERRFTKLTGNYPSI